MGVALDSQLARWMFDWLQIVIAGVSSLLRTRAALKLEHIALPHQIGVLQGARRRSARACRQPTISCGFAVPHLEGVALGASDRQARNRRHLAPERVSPLLDVEDSSRQASTAGGAT
jgi:hypothetical protein